ncbi:uncharacterized protein LOC100901175 [Galendromus occidentalis]|uniref:Uncharacterized protein LOC100901175 n=1 Tax=Galendromus occidentalis TaxID=34638 RepID=A0AAJ6VZM8_9ACAR|nr:uncharacterized protein LOC100901175 [Galendromus occidentalis]
MSETVLYAALTASPVILPYAYVVGGTWSLILSFCACLFTVPTCAFINSSLRGDKLMFTYPLLIPLCLPLSALLNPSSLEWKFSVVTTVLFGTLVGLRVLVSVSRAPLKVPQICVSTRRRIAHVISSQIFPKFSTSFNALGFLLVISAAAAMALTRSMKNTSFTGLLIDTSLVAIMMSVFYNTCLATTRLFMTLPPLRLNGRKICEGLAKRDKVAFWEASLFVASGRASREYVWEISPIGGRILNWGTMVEPALKTLKDATAYLEKNRPKRSVKFSWKKPALIDIPELEQVLWCLDAIGILVYHAYRENKNGVVQVHFRQVMDILFNLELAAQGHGPNILQDRIQNTLYKICTKYSSALHSLDIDQRFVDRFVSYSDFRI